VHSQGDELANEKFVLNPVLKYILKARKIVTVFFTHITKNGRNYQGLKRALGSRNVNATDSSTESVTTSKVFRSHLSFAVRKR